MLNSLLVFILLDAYYNIFLKKITTQITDAEKTTQIWISILGKSLSRECGRSKSVGAQVSRI